MDVSIVILNYNTFTLTCKCIASVIEFTSGIDYEIILVDNNSTDVPVSEFRRRFPEIKVVESQVNVGFAKGNNLGIAKANGKYVLLLNSDAMFLNNVILILKNFLLKNSSVAVVSGRLEYPDGTVQNNCQRFPSIRYKVFELLRLQKLLPRGAGGKILLGFFFDHNEVAFPDWVWGTCFMFQKDTLSSLPGGKLADEFFMYGEDVQWCFEFRKLGYRIGFEPAARILHLVGKSGGKKLELMEQNMRILSSRYYSVLHLRIIRILDSLLT